MPRLIEYGLQGQQLNGRAVPRSRDWFWGIIMFYIYILRSDKDKSYYIGSTSNLTNRLREHNFGNTRYTKLKRPWVLLYSEEYPTRGLAMIRENQLKKIKNRIVLEKVIGKGP